jgi:hypothetical protein
LARTIGLNAPQTRAPDPSELHERVRARLRAEAWYDDLLVTARQRKGRAARRRRKIARLLLARIGRHWQPRVDKMALKSWLDRYKTHAVWLHDRIDPSWIAELDGRLRRREIFWLCFYGLFLSALLLQYIHVAVDSVIDGLDPLWPVLSSPFVVVFLVGLLWMLASTLLKLLIPGWSGFGDLALVRLWGGRVRAIWSRRKAKGQGDAG